jgi:hypothetical protein
MFSKYNALDGAGKDIPPTCRLYQRVAKRQTSSTMLWMADVCMLLSH